MNERRIIERLAANPHDMQVLLLAHLNKPEKYEIYADALRKCTVGDALSFVPTWSWWAFFGGPFFFFYRKLYREGLILTAIAVLLFFTPLPFVMFAINIAIAFSAKYLYCKKFIADLEIAGYPSRSINEVEHSVRLLGGYNTWAVVLGVLFNFVTIVKIFILVGIIAVGSLIFSMGAIGIILVIAFLLMLFKGF